ncbi:4'-phosphopantetheinyl transferase superfamily protein [Methylomonas sp. SURF-2]|uniref:4'-phosphopantetheinyl transferase superfamily protein n=1 Tax=Methylomonas subterranea TaxID=2952225 RepID=A0ABT1TKZ5_9GAMM|nr:4'-phosphopantetheinyl transferase superfamily protein [Methylomonas sp. SURF-2]MCQ8105886.1 4'-phosphopantetheinyl transferase superfamily protein [Methylomonas sp. SURF-2]
MLAAGGWSVTGHFVDIWRGRVAVGDDSAGLWGLLSDEERGKAEKLINDEVRMRYISARAVVRRVLSGYLACKPEAVRFALGEHGKPYLPGQGIYFNLSHSRDALLLAVSDLRHVGIDIEAVKPRKGMPEIARRCFSEKELAVWLELSPRERTAAFFRLWTIKEAFVKAVGRGLSAGLERCEVDMTGRGRLLAIPGEYGRADDWTVAELVCGEGFAAALVVPKVDFIRRDLQV